MANTEIQVTTLIRDTLQEVNAIGIGDTPDAATNQFVFARLVRLFDNWNVEKAGAYASDTLTFTLIPVTNPHTIGPGGDWEADTRPIQIETAELILSDADIPVRQPITIRDKFWWSALSVPTLETSIPTDLYYNPQWELGQVFLWPVPTTAYDVSLLVRLSFVDIALDDTIWLPPGYLDAVVLTLAEMIASPVTGKPAPGDITLRAQDARARIFNQNDVSRRIVTFDSGMPSSTADRCTFNYKSGMDFPAST